MKKLSFNKTLITGLALTCGNTFAGENLWVYAKGTDTRPAGSYEFKLSDTIRLGKNAGDHYTFHDIHPEVEYGLTDSLTIGAELIIFSHDYDVGSEDEGGPCPMCEAGDGSGKFNKTQYAGYEVSLKYNVLSPYKDVIGLSFGLGYEHREKYRLDGGDIDQDSFVGTVFLQKDFLDDTLVTVLNIKTEFERRRAGSVLEDELALDIAAGISYRFAPQWFVGLEFRHQSDYLNPQDYAEAGNTSEDFDENGYTIGLQRSSFDLGDFRIGSQHQNGNYFGPTLHFAEQMWWVTGGILWQVSGGGSQYADVRNGRNWDEHEKVHIGLSYGYEF
jgi:opacity protein-like surface antigen